MPATGVDAAQEKCEIFTLRRGPGRGNHNRQTRWTGVDDAAQAEPGAAATNGAAIHASGRCVYLQVIYNHLILSL